MSSLHFSRLHLNNDSDGDYYLDVSDDTDQQLLVLKKSLPSPEAPDYEVPIPTQANVYEVPISIQKEYEYSKIGEDDEHHYESM